MLGQDPEAMREVRRVLSTWYLGFSPATTMVNGAQLLVRGATEMTSLTGKPIQSFGRIISASKEALGLSKPPPELAKEREWLWRQVKDEGVVSAYNEGDPANDGMEALQQALGEGAVRKRRDSSWAKSTKMSMRRRCGCSSRWRNSTTTGRS